MKVADLRRRHNISHATYYAWFGGMNVSEAQRLRSLEKENRKRKGLVADQTLDIIVLKDLLSKAQSLQVMPF